jgi:tetratricopeptide (TPR) repeat protein
VTDQQAPHPPGQRLTLAQAYQAAVAAHRQGRLDEAARIYRAVLQGSPNHVDSLHYLGVICNQQGRRQEGETLLRRALQLDPNAAAIANDLGIALAGLGRFDEAIDQYRRAMAVRPNFIDAHNNLGTALQALNRCEEAVGAFEKALAIDPGAAAVHNNLGIAYASMSRHEEATACYREAIASQPDLPEPYYNLGLSLAALGRPEEAIAQYRKAVALKPSYFEAHKMLASALASAREFETAFTHFRAALAVRPQSAETQYDFGNALAAAGRHAEAVVFYRRALAMRPQYPEAHNNLGNVLATIGKPAEAVAHYGEALVIRPDYAEAHGNRGNAFFALGQMDEALASLEKALTLDPNLADAQHNLGNVLQTLGRLEEARHAFERAVALAPKREELYRPLAESKQFHPGDPHLLAMEELARDAHSLTDTQRLELHFALGKAYADLDRHEPALRHFQEGNALKRKQVKYDEKSMLQRLRDTAAVFSAEWIRRNEGLGDPAADSIFIVGMPRSGTTLVEQVLASHPKVFAAGEMTNFAQATEAVAAFPEGMRSLTAEQLREIGARYAGSMRALAPAAERITDKMPSNFRFAGLIHLALPNARIIHVRRDPIDTCLSCFSKIFTGDQPFSYDLGELGRFYRAYDALMAHWRRVLPAGAMLEVQYEELVADFEKHARGIVAHCGLAWDERCLAFHETKRPVLTASAVQVRQPLYRSAVGRWRPYATMLAPLLQALESDDGGRTTEDGT